MTKVVNLYKEPYDVYMGRTNKRLGLPESIWHNPFYIGKDGDREQVVKRYKEYILKDKYLLSRVKELKGKVLGCYCKPQLCHGDILAELAEEV